MLERGITTIMWGPTHFFFKSLPSHCYHADKKYISLSTQHCFQSVLLELHFQICSIKGKPKSMDLCSMYSLLLAAFCMCCARKCTHMWCCWCLLHRYWETELQWLKHCHNKMFRTFVTFWKSKWLLMAVLFVWFYVLALLVLKGPQWLKSNPLIRLCHHMYVYASPQIYFQFLPVNMTVSWN